MNKIAASREQAVLGSFQPIVDAGELAGAAALVWRHGGDPLVVTAGRRDLVTGEPVQRDTVFRIASMSKPITTVAALLVHADGGFDLDEPVTRVAPELTGMRVLRSPDGPLDATDPVARAISFRDLLTQRAGLSYPELQHGPLAAASADALGPEIDNPHTPGEWIARLATLPLVAQPGAAFHYGHATDLLGFLIARIDGASLGDVLRRRVFVPLGMSDTGFSVPAAQRHRRAGLCGFDAQGRLAPLTVTPGGHALADRPHDMTFESGGQGLWSTLDDYLAFARMLVGASDVPLLREDLRTVMTSNQLTTEQRASATLLGQHLFATGHGFGMGVAVVTDPERADPLRGRGGVGTVSWPGAYGGWWQADPTQREVRIFLAHNMVDLPQMGAGVGLGVWGAIAQFHAACEAS